MLRHIFRFIPLKWALEFFACGILAVAAGTHFASKTEEIYTEDLFGLKVLFDLIPLFMTTVCPKA